ncbi:MAG: hypothetical protein IT584_00765 [Chlamydiae bacterium]|nr:hypothetical protein [Chlamydiota bacterium]
MIDESLIFLKEKNLYTKKLLTTSAQCQKTIASLFQTSLGKCGKIKEIFMDISAVGDDFDGDSFDFEDRLKSMSNGRLFEILPGSFDARNNVALAMMKQPSEASISGGYSEEHGFNFKGEITWTNDPGPPPRERERSQERENTNHERETSSRDSSSEKTNDSSASSEAKN